MLDSNKRALAPLLLALALGITGCGEDDPTPSPTPAATPTPTQVPSDRDGDGLSEAEGDCDDRDTATLPGAPEYPDHRDNDCDGQVDEGTEFYDLDGDGYSPIEGDCDDTNPDIHPGAEDIQNGIDDDCSGVPDTSFEADREEEPSVYVDVMDAAHRWHREQGEQLLAAVAEAKWMGDLTGDGIEDVVISSVDTDLLGRVFVLEGPVDALPEEGLYDALATWTIDGVIAENTNGVIIAGGGDINGDGIDDLLIGDPLHRRVGLFYGGQERSGSLTTADADAVFIPETGGFWTTGLSLAIVGDVNGDGADEFVLGQPTYAGGRGRALVFRGGDYEGFVDVETAQTTFEGEAAPEAFGGRIFPAGDMNGDGLKDFAILAPGSGQALEELALEHGWVSVGGPIDVGGTSYITLVYGDRNFGDVPGLRQADSRIDPFGGLSFLAVSGDTGDFDGDGYDDLALGFPIPGAWYAHARVLYGSPDLTPPRSSINDWEQTLIIAPLNDIAFGRSIALGDVDGDGQDDLAIASMFRFDLKQEQHGIEFCNDNYELSASTEGEESCFESDFGLRFSSGDISIFRGDDRPDILSPEQSGHVEIGSEEYFEVLVDIVAYTGGWQIALGEPITTGLYYNVEGAHFLRSVSISTRGGRGDVDGLGQDILIGSNLAGSGWVNLGEDDILGNSALIMDGHLIDFHLNN